MKISNAEHRIIKREMTAIGKKYSSANKFIFCIGARYNLDTGDNHINVMMVSPECRATGEWPDTDLYDNSHTYADTMLGELEVTEDGLAVYDFWIYEPHEEDANDHGDLVCNGQAYFDKDGLQRIDADVITTWKRD